MMRRIDMRHFALLSALVLAGPAAAQERGIPARFPGVEWGVDADSVIRAWGEPHRRGPGSRGLEDLTYVETRDDGDRLHYVLVHPSLGAVIVGRGGMFETEAECRTLAASALADLAASFPAFEWRDEPPEPVTFCAGQARGPAEGRDPASGTRVSLRLDASRSGVVMDAISDAGYEEWLGRRGRPATSPPPSPGAP
jgi:hypothetical protein